METRYRKLAEAREYERRQLPTRRDVYTESDHAYLARKMMVKKREMGVPKIEYDRCGLLPEMDAVWFARGGVLTIWSDERNEMEEVGVFPSDVLHVRVFVPKEGIFNERISHCLFVATGEQLLIYGIGRDTLCLVNTDFVTSLPSSVTCVAIRCGDVF